MYLPPMEPPVKYAVVPHFAWKKQQTKRRKRRIVVELLSEYSSSSTLHGIGYIGAKDKTLPEKLWWIVTFIMSACFCAYLIGNTWIKWEENPIMLNFASELVNIRDIPFPAVTVCPINKVLQSKYNYTNMFRARNNLTFDEYKEFWDISLTCNLENYLKYVHNFNCTLNFTDDEALTNIFKVAPRIEDIIVNPLWQGTMKKSLFTEIITRDGLCFSFNIISQEDMFTDEFDSTIPYINHKIRSSGWTLEKGYPSNIREEYPLRTSASGVFSALTLLLKTSLLDNDYVCRVPIEGYKIMLHNPTELPLTQQQYYLIPPEKSIVIMIQPEMIVASTSIQSMSVKIRKCYFAGEKILRFYRTYSVINCVYECLANMTFHYCGYATFYMPRVKNTPTCGFSRMECVIGIMSKYLSYRVMENGYIVPEKEKLDYKIFENCACLPTCYNLQFTAEVTEAKLNAIDALRASGVLENNGTQGRNEEKDSKTVTFGSVDIFFKESQFLALQRNALYGKTDFLANCGGLLGLFLGFSIMSLIEIIYFLTLRLWCKLKHQQ